ncbi:uncharacterized protein VTP21DRAFT_5 [Calcarisporiella thermophila]|uniref:uncharacterized protein n=1 Tax=Calcarisporiella thermophila TaxID=911321 RepID=UPI00374265DF
MAIVVSYCFWINWCFLWQRFFESYVAFKRLESDFMQTLKQKALEEYVKGVTNVTLIWQDIIHRKAGCTSQFPEYIVYRMHKLIARMHPDRTTRRSSFQQLLQTLWLLKSCSKTEGLIVLQHIREIESALEEMKPCVFTKEELKMMQFPKFKLIAIRRV